VTTPTLPLISIVIDNYNYGHFVHGAIESALHQTYPNIEVIVVDDGSADNSREVIASFGDTIISCLQENGGQTSALNTGLAASKGEWVCLLDSDDLFNPTKVARIWELAKEFPSAAVIAHDLEYCDSNGEPLTFADPYISKLKLVDDRPLARHGKMSVSLPAHSSLCFRRDIIDRLAPLPKEIRMGIDNYLKWVCLSLVPILLVPEFLGKQRIHGDNAGTIATETGGKKGQLRLARQNAAISFYMKRDHPHLSKLAWKQYGRLLYLLKSSKSAEARAIENEIRTRYSVVERSAACAFYVSAAFAKAYAEDKLGYKTNSKPR
jgi:glycosyltransferase involved in cell wall biosynthesis